MKIPSLPSGIPLSVCGFVREGDSLTALPLHQARTGNGIFLTRLVTDPLKIGGFPFSFDQLNGLVIRSERIFFSELPGMTTPYTPNPSASFPIRLRRRHPPRKRAAKHSA